LNIDMLIYVIGALLITGVTVGFVLWGFKTKQFKDNEKLKYACLEEDDE
jgi:cbb3-type cytochrome oxidase maturation protein